MATKFEKLVPYALDQFPDFDINKGMFLKNIINKWHIKY
jgi:hypothetical protein